AMRPTSFQFGGFTLDLARLRLRGPSGEVSLRPKAFEVLRYLVENAGRVVAKDELMEAVWPKGTVTDESLTHGISEVRRGIGESSRPRRDAAISSTRPSRRTVMEKSRRHHPARPLPARRLPTGHS